jgi:hypothetical protein
MNPQRIWLGAVLTAVALTAPACSERSGSRAARAAQNTNVAQNTDITVYRSPT